MEPDKNHLPGFISLAKTSFRAYRKKWKPLLKIVFASYLGCSAIIVFELFLIRFLEKLLPSPNNNGPVLIITIIALLFFLASIFILSSWFSAAIIIVLRDWQENIGLRESLRRAMPYVAQYFLINALTASLIFAGFVFFIVPGILMLVWFLFSGYIIFFDNEKGINVFLKSKHYVRGLFWNVFILLLELAAALFFMNYIFHIFEYFPFGKLIRSAANATASPLATIYLYLIFINLRKIKGEPEFGPKTKQKGNYVLFGVLFAAILIAAGILFYYSPQVKQYLGREMEKIRYQTEIGPLKNQ